MKKPWESVKMQAGPNKRPLYNLDQIRQFAGNEPEGLHRILTSFVDTSFEHLALFRKYVHEKDLRSAADLAHKMLPIFRHLEADQVVSLLLKLERLGACVPQNEEWRDHAEHAINKIDTLINLICEEQHIGVKT